MSNERTVVVRVVAKEASHFFRCENDIRGKFLGREETRMQAKSFVYVFHCSDFLTQKCVKLESHHNLESGIFLETF